MESVPGRRHRKCRGPECDKHGMVGRWKKALSGITGKQVGGEAGDPTDRRWWAGLGLVSGWEECRSHSKRYGKLLQ